MRAFALKKNVTPTKSLINKTSIFTAEPTAICNAMDIALDYCNQNVEIFTDSLSAVLALRSPENKTDSKYLLLEIL